MARPVRDFKTVSNLPLEARGLVAEAEREHNPKRDSDDAMGGMPQTSLFGPLAVAVMNARVHTEDEKVEHYGNRAAELREKVVKKLARRMTPKSKGPVADDEFDLSQFDVEEPTPAQLEAFEAYMEGHAGKAAGSKPKPSPETVERAERIVGQFMEALQDVPLKDRGR